MAHGVSRKQVRAHALAATLPKGTRCENCGGGGPLHAHHDDYDQPLSVRWLCPSCHGEWHTLNGPGANRLDKGSEERLAGITFPTGGSLLGWATPKEGGLGS